MRLAPLTALCLAFAPLLAGCEVGLLHGLDEPQANEILAALQRAGVEAHKEAAEAGRWDVSLPEREQARAWEVLRANSLPRAASAHPPSACAERSLLPTPSEERACLEASLGARLEGSLLALDGVLEARVHVVLPAPALGRAPAPPSAAVLLKVRAGASLPSEAELRGLVAGAVEGLAPEGVSLLVQRAAPLAQPSSPAPSEAAPGQPPRVALVALVGLVLAQSGVILWMLRRRRAGGAP